MRRVTRLTSATALAIIWFLTCSQVIGFAGGGFQEASSSKPEVTPKKQATAKKAKKKKRKKSLALVPYVVFPMAQTATEVRVTTPGVVAQEEVPVTARGTTRIAKSPRVHITPVTTKTTTGAPSFSGSNTSAITIDAVHLEPAPIPAIPYSSDIDVVGLTGLVTSVTVSVNGLSHSSPDDLDMLLVAPNGRSLHFWSDVGGTTAVDSVTVTVSDAGAGTLPDDGPLVDGTTYRPFNGDTTGDDFPLPAPGPPYGEPTAAGSATFASEFNGMTGDQAGGTWRLFVTDDQDGNGGVIAGGWTLNITTQVPATTAGQLIISEFRTSGTFGANDEFIELYNTTGAPLLVQSSDLSGGLGVAASDGVVRCVVPDGTVVPANGHFLCVNNSGQGALRRSPVDRKAPAAIDAFFNLDIPENAGLALFSSSAQGPGSQNLSTRLDAVGSTQEANTLYREGLGYTPFAGSGLEYTF